MTDNIEVTTENPFAGADWFDPLETAVRQRVRGFIEELLEAELSAALARGRYQRGARRGHRNGHRERRLIGTFGPLTVSVPRARVSGGETGKSEESHSQTLPAYKRVTRRAEALIASSYLAGTNTRRVRRALAGLFGGAIGKDTVSQAWRKLQSDWQAWQQRDLAGEDIVRLILDGTVVWCGSTARRQLSVLVARSASAARRPEGAARRAQSRRRRRGGMARAA
jgi:transposase-like protein